MNALDSERTLCALSGPSVSLLPTTRESDKIVHRRSWMSHKVCGVFISYKFTRSNQPPLTVLTMGRKSEQIRSSPRPSPVTLSADTKKPSVPLKSSAPLAVHIFEFLITIHAELKKDPGVPRLPNLKVRSAEKQRRRSVGSPYRSAPVFD
jgi:hypothetical protein